MKWADQVDCAKLHTAQTSRRF